MARLLLHFALCLPLLACPAMTGWCCAASNLEPTATTVSKCCDDCHREHNDESHIPFAPSPCHDCICTGALPPTQSSILPQLDFGDHVQLDISTLATQSVCKPCGNREFPRGMTLSGQAMLRTYCAFLL